MVTTVQAISEIWKTIQGLDREGKQALIVNDGRFTRYSDVDAFSSYWFEGEGSLGIVPRLVAIRSLLADGDIRGFDGEYERRRAKRKAFPSITSMKSIFHLGSGQPLVPVAKLKSPDLSRFFAEWLCEDKRTGDALEYLSRELFRVNFGGTWAVDDYAIWLTGGSPVRSAVAFLPLHFDFIPSAEREKFYARVRGRIFGWGDDNRILTNLYQAGMPNGLTALASRIAQDPLRADGRRRVFYVPLRNVNKQDAPSYLQILGYLKACYGGGSVENWTEIDPRDVDATIEFIRRAMMVSSATVLFDGYVTPKGGLKDLEGAIRDDQVISLIGRLSQPPLAHGDKPVDLAEFRRNRLVLFSDAEVHMPGMAPIIVPLPSADTMEAVLANRRFDHEALIMEWFTRIPELKGTRSESVLSMMDTLIEIEHLVADRSGRPLQPMRTLGELERHMNGRRVEDAAQSLADFILDRMRRHCPSWYALVVLMALTPDGLRVNTALRVCRALGAAYSYEDNVTLASLREVDRSVVEELLVKCRSILAAKRSDGVEGLDDYDHPWEFNVRAMESNASGDRQPRAMDFSLPELRTFVLARVSKTFFEDVIQPLHRLLAEEALSQATIAFRHNDDASNSRHMRRLLSALYHGFQSLPLTESGLSTKKSIRSPEFGIPEDPQNAWDWLYLFAYRRVIEQPPSWHLSRSFGLDALKLDILELANQPWRAWPSELKRSASPSIDGLVTSAVRDPRSAEIAKDFFLCMSQAQYALGAIPSAYGSLEEAKAMHARSADPSASAARQMLFIPSLAKRQMDIDLLRDDFKSIEGVESWFLETTARVNDVAAYRKQIQKELRDLVKEGNFQQVVDLVSSEQAISSLSQHPLFRGTEDLSDLSSILFRIGEAYAMRADMLNADTRANELEQLGHSEHFPLERYEEVIDHFCTSMGYFRFAEATRLTVFSGEPTGSHFFASGHSARQMIRVGLKLEQLARRGLPPRDGRHGFFARRARHMANVMTRHLWRFPRERASMLILEASIARLLSDGTSREPGLLSARRFLDRAEPVVLLLGDKARVRMRLVLERMKVHRRLAVATHSKLGIAGKDHRQAIREEAERYFRLAEEDYALLRSLNEEQQLELWTKLTDIQKESLKRARKTIGIS